MNLHPFVRLASPVVAIALLAGCAGFHIEAPAGFATLEHPQPSFDYRAVSAYGVALGVRRVPNHEHAALSFWAEAIDRQVQHDLGYAPVANAEVRGAHGAVGRRLEYAVGAASHPTAVYEVAVFANDRAVYLVEAGGGAQAFARARPGIDRAVATFEPM